jgi:hypothetical protein
MPADLVRQRYREAHPVLVKLCTAVKRNGRKRRPRRNLAVTAAAAGRSSDFVSALGRLRMAQVEAFDALQRARRLREGAK